jgi:hypothetical protein
MTSTVDGVRYNLPQSGLCAMGSNRGPELEYDYEYAHEYEFSAFYVACGGLLPCGQLNGTVLQPLYPQLFAKIYLRRMPRDS